MDYCFYLDWRGWPPEVWAAWTQALLSVIAIGIAIAVPAVQHRLDRIERRRDAALKSRSMAMSLHSDFQAVSTQLNNVWAYEHQDQFEETDHPPVGIHTSSALSLPPHLRSMSDRLHELGVAAEAAQKCVFCINRARELVTTKQNGEQVIFVKADFYDLLWEATVLSGQVLSQIDAMFED